MLRALVRAIVLARFPAAFRCLAMLPIFLTTLRVSMRGYIPIRVRTNRTARAIKPNFFPPFAGFNLLPFRCLAILPIFLTPFLY